MSVELYQIQANFNFSKHFSGSGNNFFCSNEQMKHANVESPILVAWNTTLIYINFEITSIVINARKRSYN